MGKALTADMFFERALNTWGDRWDYTPSQFTGTKALIEIVCKDHGSFLQQAGTHLLGKVGCPECSGRGSGKATFLRKAKEVWGDRWDYSLVEYQNNNTSVTLGCPEHGPFTQLPKAHLRGANGCPECGKTTPLTQEVFERRVLKVWGSRWGLGRAVYVTNSTPVELVCEDHGNFTQIPATLFLGQVGCGRCNKKKPYTEDYVQRAREFWEDRWDYAKTEYTSSGSKVVITCPQHGDFEQILLDHLYGHVGCTSCQGVPKTSQAEEELASFIQSYGFGVELRRRGVLANPHLEVDIYVPSLNLGIEYNGCYYHSELFRAPDYHKVKYDKAAEAGVRLIQVWEDDYLNRPHAVLEHIRQLLGVSELPKVPARKTEVVIVSTDEARTYLNKYHIQGFHPSTHYLGLKYNDVLVAVAAFKKQRGDYQLTRYATSANVQGGHSKLITHFERTTNYGSLITFADLTFSDGNLYRATGWIEGRVLAPDYRYLVGRNREHKFNYRKSRFKSDPALQYQEGLSEGELAALNGLVRVYDAGKVRYVKPHPSDTTKI